MSTGIELTDKVVVEAENSIFYAVQELAETERGYLKSLNKIRKVCMLNKKSK